MENKLNSRMVSVVALIIFSTFVLSKSENNTVTEVPIDDEENNPFKEIDQMDDKELWDMLKQASRNSSENENTVYDYGDYEEFDENQFPDSTANDVFDPTLESTTAQEETASQSTTFSSKSETDNTNSHVTSESTESAESYSTIQQTITPTTTEVSNNMSNTAESTVPSTVIPVTTTETSTALKERNTTTGTTENTLSPDVSISTQNTTESAVSYTSTGVPLTTTETTSSITGPPNTTTENIVIPTTTETPKTTTESIVITTTKNIVIPTETQGTTTESTVIPTTTETQKTTTENIVIPTTTESPKTTTESIVITTTKNIVIPTETQGTTTESTVIAITTETQKTTTENTIIPTTTEAPETTSESTVIPTTTETPKTTTESIVMSTTTEKPKTTTKNIVIPTTTEKQTPTTKSIVKPTTTETQKTTTENIVMSTTTEKPKTTTESIVMSTTTETPKTTTESIVMSTTTEKPKTTPKNIVIPTTTEKQTPTTKSIVKPTTTETQKTTTENIVMSTTTEKPKTTTESIVMSTTTEKPKTTTENIVMSNPTETRKTTTENIVIPTTTEKQKTTTENIVIPTTTEKQKPSTESIVKPTTTETQKTTTENIVIPTTTETPESTVKPTTTEKQKTTTENIVMSTTKEKQKTTTENIIISTTKETPKTTTKNIVTSTTTGVPKTATENIVIPITEKIGITVNSTTTRVPTTTMLPTTTFKHTDSTKITTTKVQKTTTTSGFYYNSSVKPTKIISSTSTTENYKSSLLSTTTKKSSKVKTTSTTVKPLISMKKIHSHKNVTKQPNTTTVGMPSKPFITNYEKPTPLPKANKFDPNRIAVIDNDNDDITGKPVTDTCSGKHCSPTRKNNLNIFDNKKLFMIDEATSPTMELHKTSDLGKSETAEGTTNRSLQGLPETSRKTINVDTRKKYLIPEEEVNIPQSRVSNISPDKVTKTNKLDPSRIFTFVEESTTVKNNARTFRPQPFSELHPVINTGISLNLDGERRRDQHRGLAAGERGVNQQGFRGRNQSIPELICFQIRGQDRRMRLNCVHVNSTVRANSRPFLVDIKQRNDFQPQNNLRHRHIFFQDRNRHAVVMNPSAVPRQRVSYNLRGGVYRTETQVPVRPPSSFKVEIKVPGSGIQIDQRGMRAFSGPITITRNVGHPGYPVWQRVPPSQGQGELSVIIPRRRKRSASSNCNTNGLYEDEGRTLTFVFDYTGSMSSELNQMRETAKEITTQMTGSKKALIKDYVLVLFNDPVVQEPYCTTSYTDFLEKLDDIRVTGGQDCPEMSLTGLYRALTVSRDHSFIFVITDANEKDTYMEGSVLNLLQIKQPSVYFLLTDTCGKESKAYQHISDASSSGQIIKNLDKSGVKDMMVEINKQFIKNDIVTLFRTTNPKPANTPYPVDVVLDKGVNEVTFSLSGDNPKLGVTSPDGNTTAGEKTSYPRLIVINVKRPMPGKWVAIAGSSSPHTVSAIGTSEINFKVGFSVLLTDKISETSHRPLKGGENYILIEVSSTKTVENINSIEFTTTDGKHITSIDLKNIPANETLYRGGPFIPPDGFFFMKMHGIDKDGTPITRISPSAISAQLPDLPYITMLARVIANAGEPLVIRCRVESLVSVDVKILKGPGYSTLENYYFRQTGDAYYKVRSATPDDAGSYQCSAKNIAGEKYKNIEVSIIVKPPVITVEPIVLYKTGSRVELLCRIISGVPYTVQWLKGQKNAFYPLEESSRIYRTSNGLIIENPQESDEAWYQCSASNSGGENNAAVYLKRSRLPHIENSPNQSYQRNFNISITCSATGYPPPSISWLKNGQNIPLDETNRIIFNNSAGYGEIYINSAVVEDEGIYTCVASNFAGKVSKETNLTYEELPKVTSPERNVKVIVKEDVLLRCQVTGVPTPNVRWEKNDASVDQDSVPNHTVLSDHSLFIRPSSLIHNGIYTCIASNEIGSDEVSIRVVVSGVPPEITEPPEDAYIEIGESGRLTCGVSGNPEPKISWRRSGEDSIHATQTDRSLEFFNASMADVGEYWCIAENTLGRKEAHSYVFITGGVAPVIDKIKDMEVTKVLVGEKVELPCSIIGGKPYPRIVWYKDGAKLQGPQANGIQLENGSYFISTINPSDTGLFECTATNELGRDVKKIMLQPYEPPKIDANTSTTILATIGNSAKLECLVTGDPQPNVTWKRYSHATYKVMKGIKLEDTNALYFEKVTEDDTGRYICKAENIAGIARRPFALYVLVPPKIGVWPVEMFVEIGNIVTLECRVRAIPRPTIIWMKDDETIPRSRYYGQFLRFYANSNDSGTYSCTAENRAGKDRVETKLIVLVPPQIADSPSRIKTISGNEAVLPCKVSGSPQPTISWQWNGELIKKELGSDSGTLNLFNVTEADAGTYICTAQNKAGTNKKKTELIVLTPPKILPWTHPLKVVIGEFINVTCQHFANPEARITWYKDKILLSPKYIGEKNRLEFIAQSSHGGVFTCEAENEAGKDSKDFLLVILDRPSFALHQPYTYDVLIGKDIEIPCVAFGEPKPIMGWNRTDIIITTSSKRMVNPETGLMVILNASAEDEGYYNCTAKNRAGEIWRTVEVNVLELPTAKLSVSNEIIKEGDEVKFTCLISGKPEPKIHWKKDGKVLSTENNKHLSLIAYYKDQGNYTCIVKNAAGEDFSTVHLNVSVFPVIHGHLEEDLVVLEGEDILLNCSSEGIPPPIISWFYNGTLLDKFSIYSEIINNSFLKISETSKERSGLYTCEVQNFAGTAKKQFRLNVHVKPSITDNYDTEISLTEWKDFSLPCNAQGIPQPRISWLRNGTVIPKASGTVLSPSTYDNLLLIFNADNSSAGSYTCYAENIEGTTTKNYTIIVKALEIPSKPGVENVEVIESANGVLNCGATPGSEIIWFKDNKTLNKMPLERADDVHFVIGDGGNSLKIAEAFPADSGLFSCQASHLDGNSTKLFSVNVLVPPYFIDFFPETDFTVKENESLTLECPIQGNPPPVVNWRSALSNIPVDEFTVPGARPFGTNGNKLLIKSAKPSHTGIYLCSGFNKMGKEHRTFNVKVVGPPKIIGLELTRLDIISGTQLELNCLIDGASSPTFKWSLLHSSGEETNLKYVSQKIHIGYAQSEDEGLYTCIASNSYGNVTKQFNISVYDAPRIKRETNDKIVLAQGEVLYLHCMGEGRKPFVTKWFFNKEEMNATDDMSVEFSSTKNEFQYSYRVDNVTKVSQGIYSCLLSNIAGSDQTEFQVEVIDPPEFSKPTVNEKIEINIGSPIHVDCPMESENDFRIQWKKNGILLPGFENRSLVIPVTTVEDDGTYTCIGSNIAGSLKYKLDLHIRALPQIIASNDDVNVTVLVDENLILNCSVSGNPKPGILWTKNFQQINDEAFPQIILLNDDQILKIDEVIPSDVGKYSCFPSNVVGSTEKHFDVTVIEPPSVIEGDYNVTHKTVEKVITSDIYKRAVLRCPLTGSPEPEITWFKESEEINKGDKRFRVSLDRKVLVVNHAEESVAGIFKCFGMNGFGETTFIFHFHIRIPMVWSSWSKWSKCNATCGGGSQSRGRKCLGERNDLLSEYIHLHNDSCTGTAIEVQRCNEHICPVNGGWDVWSEWGSCSSSCGRGWRRRTRRCNNPVPAYGGSDCSGETYEDEECDSPPCPINGNWGEWSDWSECSATCGLSIKMRTRRCNNPAPAYGGLPCSENSRDITVCNQRKCPTNVDGWSSWSRWTPCSATCGTGRQSRLRTCLLEAHGGSCSGNKQQYRLCKNSIPCIRRFPRHAELKIHGEINNQQIEESVKAEIIKSDNDSPTIFFSKTLSPNETFSYLPFVTSPVTWFTAQENNRGRNGYSLTNGSFHENSTYRFSTGEEMEMMSDAQNEESEDSLKLNIKIRGNVPSSPTTASIIISPYSEYIIQKDPNIITSSSTVNLDADGEINPVTVRKTVLFSGNRGSRIFPVETLTAEGSRSYYNRNTNQLEFRASPSVISSKLLRDACPLGFKFNVDTKECTDLNECRRRGLNTCLPSQICINTMGSYICECRQGFRVAPNTGCKDINECLEGFHQCSHRCVNTRGSYQCLCPKRLILAEDMHNCVEESEDYYYTDTDSTGSIDYQLISSDSARGDASHRNGKGLNIFDMPIEEEYAHDQTNDMMSSGSMLVQDLSCRTGFRSGQDGCEDVNECSEDENSCTKEQLCMNTPGSFVCIEAPCPDNFFLSAETRSCVLLCLEEEEECTDGATLSESLQIITVPVYNGNYTFQPYTDILEMTSYDNNDLPLSGSIYDIVQNEAGLPVNIRTEKRLGVLFAVKYFEVTKEERLVLMSSKYDHDGSKLHSTMFVLLIYNIKSTNF